MLYWTSLPFLLLTEHTWDSFMDGIKPLVAMDTHLYFTLLPEALVASYLAPEEFGKYQAVGVHHRSSSQSVFFEINPDFDSSYLPVREIVQRCRPHDDGSPRKSTYLGVYRVLEHLPLEAFGALYVTTDDGRVLQLDQGAYEEESDSGLYLYQEFVPVQPRVVSSLSPSRFSRFITDRNQPVSVDRIVFCDLRLDDLARDPINGNGDDLPYGDLAHLRDCLASVWRKGTKDVKVVNRFFRRQIHFRMIRRGFYVGGGNQMLYYPMPPKDAMETIHYEWWRSAQTQL